MSLIVDDLSSFPDTLMNGWYMGMQLSTVTGTTLALSVTCTEEVAGSLVIVDTADETIPEEGGSISDGDAWVYVGLPTPTTAETYVSNTAPTFDPDKRGYYDGSYKAVYKVTKTGTDYSDRKRMWAFSPYGLDLDGNLTVSSGSVVTADNHWSRVTPKEDGGSKNGTLSTSFVQEMSVDLAQAGVYLIFIQGRTYESISGGNFEVDIELRKTGIGTDRLNGAGTNAYYRTAEGGKIDRSMFFQIVTEESASTTFEVYMRYTVLGGTLSATPRWIGSVEAIRI